jgi:hypothetical protein
MNTNHPRPGITNQTPITKTSKLITLDSLGLDRPPSDKPAPDPALELYYKQQREEDLQRERGALFKVKTARMWIDEASRQPAPNSLFDDFWYEKDLCILFADTNLGKSVLAVQIADSISRGAPIPGFAMSAFRQPVLYFDFELTAKQFQMRYTEDYENEYPFTENFFRAEINMDDDYEQWGFKSFETYLYDQIERYIDHSGIKVVIIDNLTALRSDNERARDAYPIMQMLNAIKKNKKVSMLVIAHTPKRDNTKPIEENHLQGSKQFSNLCDSMFAIGKSHRDPRIVYLKQIKHRSGAKKYEEDNICLCQIVKPTNFLHFELMENGREADHLKQMGDKELGAKIAAVKDLNDQGKTQREISQQLGIPLVSVNRYLKQAS